jgi:phosphoribosylformimino-5-aminoimidazole carboxamide ribonucleotide (ProFAR) isomerase
MSGKTGTRNWKELQASDIIDGREKLLFVGIDLHKGIHTTVMVNGWNEKSEVIVIQNNSMETKPLYETRDISNCIK